MPNLGSTYGLVCALIYFCGEEYSNSKGHKANQDILNHLNQGSYLSGKLTQSISCQNHGSGGVNRTADPSAAYHGINGYNLAEQRHSNHHKYRKDQGNTYGKG